MKKFFKGLKQLVRFTFEIVGDAVAIVAEGAVGLFDKDAAARIRTWRKADNSAKVVYGIVIASTLVLGAGALLGAGGAFASFGGAASSVGSGAMSAGSWAWGGAKAVGSVIAPAFGSSGFLSTAGGGALMSTGLQMAGAYFGAEAQRGAEEDAREAEAEAAQKAKEDGDANAATNTGILAQSSYSARQAPPGGTSQRAPEPPQGEGLMSRSSYRQQDQRSTYKPTDSNGKANFYDYSDNAWKPQ